MNCRCIASWSRCNLVLCDSLMRPPRGLQSGSEKCFIILYEYLNQVYIVQTGLTPPPAMTTLAFRTTKSAAPPSLHPKLQLFSPFFFFLSAQRVATSAACLDLIFPLWQLGPQCIHFKPFRASRLVRTVTSCLLIPIVQRSMFWEKESDSLLGFFSSFFF